MKKIICILFFFAFTAKKGFSQANPDTSSPKKVYTKWVRAKDIVWSPPEVEAVFTGGEQKWFEFISVNLNREVPTKNKAPKGKYTVIIGFNIDINGKLDRFVPETENGYGMEDEVIRVFKMSPKWIPARVKGSDVYSRKKQAVVFVVE